MWVCSKCGKKWTLEQVLDLFYDWYRCPDEDCGEFVFYEDDDGSEINGSNS
jgi:DNA-directed RNA polymerase subunit RPC12/RpoP